ncbi:MAG: PLP-dependent aminotransferase family protein [Clostridiales bacterium]|nr:PLP-dependent aminotransferase family protein [Clostridiales bacterium]
MQLPSIDRAAQEPIRRQIYTQFKVQIASGAMPAGEALPSTRQLAGELSVSRSTVVEAYDMLLSEGYLSSRQGAQTVVADGLVLDAPSLPSEPDPPRKRTPVLADFSTGRPDLEQFPRALWGRLLANAALGLPPEQYGYTGPQGYAPLRQEIVAWLSRSRGLAVNAADVFITAGATHALHILAELLCPAGGRVLMEDPCHSGLFDILSGSNREIVPISVDDHGMQADLLGSAGQVSMIYVTPSHQFPLGGILPASRRAALVRFARERGAFIVEDDYDSEFRYEGAPVAPLYSMDPQRVIYVGTFSKTLFPALRIGFAILPKCLQARWRELRTHYDVQNPPFEQAALAEMLQTRRFDRHIRAMRSRYGRRRQTLLDELTREFGNTWVACGDAAGLHVAIRFLGRRFDDAFQSRCRENGVLAVPLETHCLVKGLHEDTLVLGYGHLEPERIGPAVRQLRLLMDA